MSNAQDTNSKTQAEAGESLQDCSQDKIASPPDKDALGDGALDDVSGGQWPYLVTGGTPSKM